MLKPNKDDNPPISKLCFKIKFSKVKSLAPKTFKIANCFVFCTIIKSKHDIRLKHATKIISRE